MTTHNNINTTNNTINTKYTHKHNNAHKQTQSNKKPVQQLNTCTQTKHVSKLENQQE